MPGSPAPSPRPRAERWPLAILLVLLAITLVRGAAYAAVVPPWQTPDEPKHFEYVALLYQKQRLVAREAALPELQARIIASMREQDFWRFGVGERASTFDPSFRQIWPGSPTALDRPPLYYLLALPVYGLVAEGDILLQLYALRLFSVLLGGLTVLVAFLLGREFFPRDPFLGVGVPAFVAWLPMFGFVSGSVNSDNLANLIGAVLIYLLVRALRTGLSAPSLLALAGLLLAGFWTKRTTLFAFPLALAAAPLYLAARRVRLGWAALAAGLVALVVGVAALQLPLVQSRLRWALDRYVFNYSLEANLAQYQGHDYAWATLSNLYGRFLWGLLESFWGRFGWMNIRLDAHWYQAVLLLGVASGVGLAVLLLRLGVRPDHPERRQLGALLLCLLAVALVAGIVFLQYTAEFDPRLVPQGRYLFPALPAAAVLLLVGLRELTPRRVRGATLFGFLAALFLLDALSLLGYVVPFYYR